MNERINELFGQALDQAVPETWSKLSPEQLSKLKDKFAELIVRECMSFCDETRSAYLKHRKASDDFTDKNIYAEGEAASDTIKYKMKKHFGVEE